MNSMFLQLMIVSASIITAILLITSGVIQKNIPEITVGFLLLVAITVFIAVI